MAGDLTDDRLFPAERRRGDAADLADPDLVTVGATAAEATAPPPTEESINATDISVGPRQLAGRVMAGPASNWRPEVCGEQGMAGG